MRSITLAALNLGVMLYGQVTEATMLQCPALTVKIVNNLLTKKQTTFRAPNGIFWALKSASPELFRDRHISNIRVGNRTLEATDLCSYSITVADECGTATGTLTLKHNF